MPDSSNTLELLPFMTSSDALFLTGEQDGKVIRLIGPAGEDLRKHSVEAMRCLPRRGLEVGGILLGQPSSPPLSNVVINALAPVESEHLYGPGYRQSERDQAVFQTAIDELRQASPGQDVPIGFYRTYTRDDSSPNLFDTASFHRYFPGSEAVLLLIGPKRTGRAGISCFRWNRESLIPCTLPAGLQPPKPVPELQAQPEPEPIPPVIQKPRAPVSVPVKPRSFRWLKEAALAAIAALIVAGMVSVFFREPKSGQVTAAPPAPVPKAQMDAPLAAHLENTPQGVQLVWNGKSAIIRQAAGALLSVQDGPSNSDLPISLSELQTGTLLYGKASPAVTFLLTIYNEDGAETRERITALPAPPPA